MECAQINVVGGTGSSSPTTYSIPGIYKANDPGLLINIYSMTTSSNYVIPGPAVFSCGTSGGGTNPVTTASATKASSTLVTTTSATKASSTVVTSAVPTTTQASGCSSAQWQQCGGKDFTGCKTCASPATCNVINEYYSQCV